MPNKCRVRTKKSLKNIDKELKADLIRMHERNTMLRMLNLDKIADFMLETGIGSFGFIDTEEPAIYSASITKTEDGRQKITVEKTTEAK